MQTWIFYPHDSACQWLFLHASLELSVELASRGRRVLAQKCTVIPLIVCTSCVCCPLAALSWVCIFPCSGQVRGVRWCSRWDSRGQTHRFHVTWTQRTRMSRCYRYRTAASGYLLLTLHTEGGVVGSVFELSSHLLTTTIIISSRWPNLMKYRRVKTCS